NHPAAGHLGKVPQGNGRSLAANPQEERNRRALVGANSKAASRYLAGFADRRDSRNLQQCQRNLTGTRQSFTRTFGRSSVAGSVQSRRSQPLLEAMGQLAGSDPRTAARPERGRAGLAGRDKQQFSEETGGRTDTG